MFKNASLKKISLIIFILVLLIFFIWYGSIEPDPEKGHYPGEEEILQDYGEHVGRKVEVGGRVIEEEPLKIEIEYGSEKIELQVVGEKEEANENDRITVYGTLHENNTIVAENVVVRGYWRYIYMYTVSVGAAVWVGVRLFKSWRWDSDSFSFQKRDEDLELKDMIRKNDRGGKGHG